MAQDESNHQIQQIHISGMTCESCERLIARGLAELPGVEVLSLSAQDGRLRVRAAANQLDAIRLAIEKAGYRVVASHQEAAGAGADCEFCARAAPEAMPSAGEVWNGILGSAPEWRPERTLLINAAGSLTALLALSMFLYFGLWRSTPGFLAMQMPLLLLGAVSVVALVGAGCHFQAYRRPISCSIGMMEGMTFGMMAGFLIGALTGATNGMFWGSVIGMLVGCGAGVWAGWRGGVMGVMEGLMAGIMAGTMGAMLSVMLLASPLPAFLALLTALCALILIALAYMQVKEMGRLGHGAEVTTFASMVSTSAIFFVLLAVIMVYGPKLGPVWGA